MAFATVPIGDYQATEGKLSVRRSSGFGERGFCADCGTPPTMHVRHQPDTVDLTIATLDDPQVVAPGYHIWVRSRIAWFETNALLPRHARFRVETRATTG